jgi:MerR family transcriptional regulator, copper efflux regulator
MNHSGLKVGQVALQAEVNLQTIHYYERQGLLSAPPRSATNYRLYPTDAVRRVRFIKRAQQLGFSLKEIKELLSLRAAPGTQCTDIRQRAEQKIRQLDAKMATMARMRSALAKVMKECQGDVPVSECAILDSLDLDEENQ